MNAEDLLRALPVAVRKFLPTCMLQLAIDRRRLALEVQAALPRMGRQVLHWTMVHVPQVVCPEAFKLAEKLHLSGTSPASSASVAIH